MSDVVRITVKPHVKRFLTVQFGEYLKLSDSNIYSLLLRRLFQPFDKMDPSLVRPDIKKHSLGATYNVLMGNTGLRVYGGYITGKNLIGFSDSVDLQIKQEMLKWVDNPFQPDNKVDYAIQRYLDWYGWPDEEFSFDNAKRWFYRERERQMKRVIDVRNKIIDTQLTINLLIEEEQSYKHPLINPIAERQLALTLG